MKKDRQTIGADAGKDAAPKGRLVERKYLLTFILVTSLFALWGFANDITNPMVAAFQTIMELSAAKASLVQFAFYGGYATMALPAALFVKRYSYKSGILLGLALYAAGAFLFIPAAAHQNFAFFCASLYVLTFGLAFLETTANPYILSLGSSSTATRRLNLAQAFNPMGSILGMFVAAGVVLPALQSDSAAVRAAGFAALPEAERTAIRAHGLEAIRDPYVALGCAVVFIFIVIALFVRRQNVPAGEAPQEPRARESLRRLWHNRTYREGVMAQVFYVAAQIMCWTFIIQYAERLGVSKATAQMYNIGAMGLNLAGRFAGTFLMRSVNSRLLLTVFGLCAMATTAGTILIDGYAGLVCLVATSAFMSIMFPTIYGVALEGAGRDTTLGAAFLVMAIVGGALMPPLQGLIIDCGTVMGWPAVNASFILPFVCFTVVAAYGYRTWRRLRV